ncbi:MAG: SPOR domain-containing protein [Rhodocyclaceae bacterium]|nr:SPOR domain-containing protein [Rhodocyclaceae bacterium]
MKYSPSPKQAAAKPRGNRRGKSGGGTLLGLFFGLVIGVLIAFGVVWYLNKAPLPFQDKSNRAEKPIDRNAGSTPEPLPGKPGDKVGEKPRFEFYKILPGGQEATPAPAAAPPPAPAAAPAAPAAAAEPAAGDVFYLQAGAFQKAADADNLKAKLSLLGVDVGVQEVAVPDKGTLFRVRVGPYAKPDEMNRARNQLAQNGIQATVVKISPKN